jgi:SAM-dependent methyltransferase
VGIFFRRSVIDLFITPHERQAVRDMGYDFDHLAGNRCSDNDRLTRSTTDKWNVHWDAYWSGRTWEDYLTKAEDEEGRSDVCSARVFWNFIRLEPDQIRNAAVFIACSGGGREAYHVSKHCPGLLVVNEINPYIYSIRNLLQDVDNLLLLRNDIMYSPLKSGVVDFAICDHALQHIQDHHRAYANLADSVKPGGIVSVCVYSYENNRIMTHLVEPSKRLLTRLPLPAVRALALFPALLLYAIMHGLYRPIRRFFPKVYAALPLSGLFGFWMHNTLRVVWSSCFDLMHAGISYHFKREEMENLARSNSLTIEKLDLVYDTLWSMNGRKLFAQRES